MLDSLAFFLTAFVAEALVFPTIPNDLIDGAPKHQPYAILGIRWIAKVVLIPCEFILHFLFMVTMPFAFLWALGVLLCVCIYIFVASVQFINSGTVPDPVVYLAIPALKFPR